MSGQEFIRGQTQHKLFHATELLEFRIAECIDLYDGTTLSHYLFLRYILHTPNLARTLNFVRDHVK